MKIPQRLSKNWTAWRIMRVTLSIVFSAIGIIKADYILLAAGAFLMIQALANTCVSCASGNCEIPQK